MDSEPSINVTSMAKNDNAEGGLIMVNVNHGGIKPTMMDE